METIALIVFYVIISSISMIFYFNHLTNLEKKEIEKITDKKRKKLPLLNGKTEYESSRAISEAV